MSASDVYEYTEDQMIQYIKTLREWRKALFKHPESPDYVATKTLEDHFMRRLADLTTKRYYKEKGLVE